MLHTVVLCAIRPHGAYISLHSMQRSTLDTMQ